MEWVVDRWQKTALWLRVKRIKATRKEPMHTGVTAARTIHDKEEGENGATDQ